MNFIAGGILLLPAHTHTHTCMQTHCVEGLGFQCHSFLVGVINPFYTATTKPKERKLGTSFYSSGGLNFTENEKLIFDFFDISLDFVEFFVQNPFSETPPFHPSSLPNSFFLPISAITVRWTEHLASLGPGPMLIAHTIAGYNCAWVKQREVFHRDCPRTQ